MSYQKTRTTPLVGLSAVKTLIDRIDEVYAEGREEDHDFEAMRRDLFQCVGAIQGLLVAIDVLTLRADVEPAREAVTA